MICPRHRTDACMTEATRQCFYDLIAANRDGLSQEEIAVHMGVDHSRVGQIERIALKKVRRLTARADLDLYPVTTGRFGTPVRRYGAAQ